MNLKLEFEFNKTDIIKNVDALKKQVDAMRPLPADVEGKVMQKLRLDWNYHSNAIEGNRLNYGETVAFLMEGITAKGKPLKDHLDIRGHNDAINFLLEIVKDTRSISEADIRALHKMILVEPYDSPATTVDGLPTTKRIALGEYKTSPNHVKTSTGEIHYYASPEETAAKMHDLMDWYEEVRKSDVSPIIIAALFHHKFVAIHPFDDGNGRLSRILMNLILMQSGYPPVVVKMDDRTNYYSLLNRADVGDSWHFVEYIAELMQNSLQLYLKAANGGDINDDYDIDKEIFLFKMEMQSRLTPKIIAGRQEINHTILSTLLPSFLRISEKILYAFKDFFDEIMVTVYFGEFEILIHEGAMSNLNEHVKKLINKYNVSSITYKVDFIGFKKQGNSFNAHTEILIDFYSKHYSTQDIINNFQIVKSYGELLTVNDQDMIIKNIIEDARGLIEFKLN